MLILTAKRREGIFINDENIIIRVLDIYGDYVKLGFTADEAVTIDREIIHYKKLEQVLLKNYETTMRRGAPL